MICKMKCNFLKTQTVHIWSGKQSENDKTLTNSSMS